MADDRVITVKSRKATLDEARHSKYKFSGILRSWAKESQTDSVGLTAFPVRAVALLEVFVRERVRTIVNHSKIYADRAVPLLQNFKSDYSFIIEVSHQTITFGDIVAHAVTVSSLTNVISIFERLSDANLSQELPKVIDRWEVEINRSMHKPIINDFDETAAEVGKIFDLRHRVCHEGVDLSKNEVDSMSRSLQAVADFVNALDWFLTELLYGKVPLTQTDMNLEAIARANEVTAEMKGVLDRLNYLLQNQPRALRLIAATQHAWERYKSLQVYCAHDPEGGGTIGPLIRASESIVLTEERIKRLNSHIAFSGLLALP